MSGLIYFMVCRPLGAVKIGFTTGNPHCRLKTLQTGCPGLIELYSTVPGTMDEERRLHEAFAPLHLCGEWFQYEGKLRDMACYLSGSADRGSFEGALHDVLMQGLWNPYHNTLTEEEYDATGDCGPFLELIEETCGEEA